MRRQRLALPRLGLGQARFGPRLSLRLQALWEDGLPFVPGLLFFARPFFAGSFLECFARCAGRPGTLSLDSAALCKGRP